MRFKIEREIKDLVRKIEGFHIGGEKRVKGKKRFFP